MEISINLNSVDEQQILCGSRDRHVKAIRKQFGVVFVIRDGRVKMIGDDEAVREARKVVNRILQEFRNKGAIAEARIETIIESASADRGKRFGKLTGSKGRIDLPPHVWPRSNGQADYLRNIADHEISLCVGPAGTGKTYLAVAMAVAALKSGLYKKMILARPAVEAGEKLGFLPGDLQAKVNPYLRPLYDALESFLTPQKARKYIEGDVIEVLPLAYMRGRSLDSAFIILDEAQNTTPTQMKMVLTRMGGGSKMVITGDVTQVDLPSDQVSGLVDALRVLKGVKGIGRVALAKKDIVRHHLVQKIVSAYERADKRSGD
jgi:phosphate starvation-inducible protein PhoH and related proteins